MNFDLATVCEHDFNLLAWDAVKKADVGALYEALSHANPNCMHPVLGHSLLEQAVKSVSKASVLCTTLIERGANLPMPGEPMSFELAWRAIVEDSSVLAKQLMETSPAWANFLVKQKNKCFLPVPGSPTNLDTYLSAVSAFDAISKLSSLAKATPTPGHAMRPSR